MKSIFCFFFGHRWSWRRIAVRNVMTVQRECLRCGALKGLNQ